MSHLSDGDLRAHLDAELAPGPARHLAACPACQARLAALAARQTATAGRLGALTPDAADPALAPRPALARFRARYLNHEEKTTMLSRLFRPTLRPLWTGLGLVAVLTVALAFEPVRAWAGQFLGLFRVQQVTILSIDTTGLEALTGDQALGRQISQLMASSATVLREPAAPQTVADAAAASQAAGFAVRLPAGPARLTVQPGGAFQFTLDRARAQALLDELGRQDLQLPANTDGAVVTVDIPAAVSAAYGACPTTEQESAQRQRYTDCQLFVQMPSPVVTTPPDLDVGALARIGLQLTGMTAEQAAAYSAAVDWTSTLVIPIPRNGARYQTVAVDGVTGYLIESAAGDAPEYALVWVRDGQLYAISGLNRDSAAALELARALP